jgi:superfamily II DNA or RNA helicase
VVATFQDAGGPPVMLVSLKAGGTGLNLTAADHVFLLDPWWNPAVEDQAADRAHRIGQDKPVMVYRLVARDTVEERILALQDKQARARRGRPRRAATAPRRSPATTCSTSCDDGAHAGRSSYSRASSSVAPVASTTAPVVTSAYSHAPDGSRR